MINFYILDGFVDLDTLILVKFKPYLCGKILILDGQSMIESYISRFWASYKFVYKAAVIPK